jgi:hypothetical protein
VSAACRPDAPALHVRPPDLSRQELPWRRSDPSDLPPHRLPPLPHPVSSTNDAYQRSETGLSDNAQLTSLHSTLSPARCWRRVACRRVFRLKLGHNSFSPAGIQQICEYARARNPYLFHPSMQSAGQTIQAEFAAPISTYGADASGSRAAPATECWVVHAEPVNGPPFVEVCTHALTHSRTHAPSQCPQCLPLLAQPCTYMWRAL